MGRGTKYLYSAIFLGGVVMSSIGMYFGKPSIDRLKAKYFMNKAATVNYDEYVPSSGFELLVDKRDKNGNYQRFRDFKIDEVNLEYHTVEGIIRNPNDPKRDNVGVRFRGLLREVEDSRNSKNTLAKSGK